MHGYLWYAKAQMIYIASYPNPVLNSSHIQPSFLIALSCAFLGGLLLRDFFSPVSEEPEDRCEGALDTGRIASFSFSLSFSAFLKNGNLLPPVSLLFVP